MKEEERIPLIWEIGMDQAVLDSVVEQSAAEIGDAEDFDALESRGMAASRRVARELLQRKAAAQKGAVEGAGFAVRVGGGLASSAIGSERFSAVPAR